jgi:dolichyl-phosphate-mannose-protein mannosyltransferase
MSDTASAEAAGEPQTVAEGARPPSKRATIVSSIQGLTTAHSLLLLIVAAVLVRLALTPLTAHLPNGLTDEGFWKYWMRFIDSDGVLNIFRTTDTDYVGYHWVLWLMTLVWDAVGGSYSDNDKPFHIFVKLPSILFDVTLILAVFGATKAMLREHGGWAPLRARRAALFAAAVIAFQPAVLYDSAIWAQTDSAIAAAMLAAILLVFLGRPFSAGAVWALGLAIKPHPIVIAPVLIVLLWRAGGWRALVRGCAGLVLVLALVLGPWILHGDLGRIYDVYKLLLTKERQRLSELAWNLWWVFDYRGDPRPDTQIVGGLPLTFKQVGLIISLLSAALALVYTWLRPGLKGALVAAAYLAFAFYAWPIGSHERYLYPFLGLLLPVVIVERRWSPLYVALSTTFFLNLFVSGPPLQQWQDRWVYGEFGAVVAGLNAALFGVYTVMLLEGVWRSRRRSARSTSMAPAPLV